MNLYFLTGTSSGIGLAMARLALSQGNTVIGISRNCKIKHKNYQHQFLDLSNLKEVNDFKFDLNGSFEKVILMNNAGTIGEIKPVGQLASEGFEFIYNVNLIAPSILANNFIKQLSSATAKKIILCISSGAAGYPIKSWANYCATKAGLDHFCRVISKEHPEITVMSVAPGVVNTAMQATIRTANESDFEDRQRFVDLHESGELTEPTAVAEKLMQIVEKGNLIEDTVFTLRDF